MLDSESRTRCPRLGRHRWSWTSGLEVDDRQSPDDDRAQRHDHHDRRVCLPHLVGLGRWNVWQSAPLPSASHECLRPGQNTRFCNFIHMYITGLPSSDRKQSPTFLDKIAGNISNKCTYINPNSLSTSHKKKNYSTNKVQVSYMKISEQLGYQNFVELAQSHFPDYTNSQTFPSVLAFFLTFHWHQPNSLTFSRIPVVTLKLIKESQECPKMSELRFQRQIT